jgi:hypothetical protein
VGCLPLAGLSNKRAEIIQEFDLRPLPKTCFMFLAISIRQCAVLSGVEVFYAAVAVVVKDLVEVSGVEVSRAF